MPDKNMDIHFSNFNYAMMLDSRSEGSESPRMIRKCWPEVFYHYPVICYHYPASLGESRIGVDPEPLLRDAQPALIGRQGLTTIP